MKKYVAPTAELPSADHDLVGGGVEETVCDYRIHGTSRRKDYIFSVR
jgi:hypothetical protein